MITTLFSFCTITNFFWSIQILFVIALFTVICSAKFSTLGLKRLSLFWSYILFIYISVVGFAFAYPSGIEASTYMVNSSWLSNLFYININFIVVVDGLSYVFIVLTALLIPLTVLSAWNSIKYNLKEFFSTLLIVEWLLINMFLVTDLLLFYIFFEAILIPMFFLIGVWGSRQRKTYASFMFFFYTFVGSLFMLFSLILLYNQFSTLQLFSLLNQNYSGMGALILWPLFMFAFAVKVPMFPAHIWLPEAHVEAPTVGSVLLAGVLLKLGVFAVLRFLVPIFPVETQYYAPILFIFAILGILYISFTTIRQVDLKKIIAYASVAHMNYVVLGIFGTNLLSPVGSVFLMLGHGIVSAGLFFMVGFLYDRYKTRNLRYYRGLVSFMPIYSVSLFIFSLANMSFPGSCNFIGEAIILFGVVQNNLLVGIFATAGIIGCAIYTIWLFNRTMYGPITPSIINFSDLSYKELMVLIPLLLLTIILGLFPNLLLSILTNNMFLLIELYL